MNHRMLLTLTQGAVTLLAGTLLHTQAQTWTTVHDLPNGVCAEMGQDPTGYVFAAGRQIAADGSSKATVQVSGDRGATWVVLDQYAETGLSYAHHRALAVDPVNGNHLLAGGNLNNLLPSGTYEFDTLWFIRERDPVTGLWSTVDDYSRLANDVGQASCADLLVATTGDVYATGGSSLGWLIRKRTAGAATFSTVDVDYSGQSTGGGWDLGVHSSYGVFAVGEVNGIWTVRRSASGNLGTWTTVDSFSVDRAWTSGRALCILTTPSKIHVVGSAYKYRNGSHWIVRTSSDGGQTWAITDDYAPSIPSEARGIVQDTSGNLWVCGSSVATAGGTQWVIRKGTPGTKWDKQRKQYVETINWTTVNTYQLAPGKPALPNGITLDNVGNVFVGGSAQDSAGVDHWIVRALRVP
jgi:hypothetical protein